MPTLLPALLCISTMPVVSDAFVFPSRFAGLASNRASKSTSLTMKAKQFSEDQMDFQWFTMKRNFDGTWKGRSEWYRKEDKQVLDLQVPTQVRTETQYDIQFDSETTGTWTGTGLGLTDGKVVLPLAREGFNMAPSADTWVFPGTDGGPGTGGQCSAELSFDVPRVAFETNFFHDRSRSMLVAVYTPTESQDAVILNSLNAVAFRDQRASPPDGERKMLGGVDELLGSIKGWKGRTVGEYDPSSPPSALPAPKECGSFDPAGFSGAATRRLFQDNLLCGIPEKISAGGCKLYFGCLTSPTLFKLITYTFDDSRRFSLIRYDEFNP